MVDPPKPGATALIGRESEQDELSGLLNDYSLITLVGPGGVGKTTLATELAATAADRFEGGVFVAELAGTNEDEDVAGLVARQLGANSLEALRLRSVGKPTLVVLDNCESALVASRTIALELISGDSDIRIVATSRSPLYALGERLVPVRPLSVWEDGEAGGPDARTLLGPATQTDSELRPEPTIGGEIEQPVGKQSVEGPIVAFGEYQLDSDMCELRRSGERIAMEPQVYDVLAYLVERRGHVVTKHELLDEVWGDRFVSEGALSSRIAAARRATGDDGKRQEVIRTVHGKGFSFVADVH